MNSIIFRMIDDVVSFKIRGTKQEIIIAVIHHQRMPVAVIINFWRMKKMEKTLQAEKGEIHVISNLYKVEILK